MRFMKMGTVTVTLGWGEYIGFYLWYPHLSTDLVKIQNTWYPCDVIRSLRNYEFRESWYSESHDWHIGPNEKVLYFLQFSSDLDKIWYNKSVYSDGEQLVKQRHILTWVQWNIASTFHIFHQFQAKFSTGHVHSNVLGDCKSCKNQHSKSHTLLRCIHGFLSILAQWLRRCATNRKVAGLIRAGIIGIFHWHKIFTIALRPWGRLIL